MAEIMREVKEVTISSRHAAAKVVWSVFFCSLAYFVGTRLTIFAGVRAELLEPWSLLSLGLLFDVAVAGILAGAVAVASLAVGRLTTLAASFAFMLVWGAILFVVFDLVFFQYSGVHFTKSFWAYFSLKNLFYIRASVFDQLSRPRNVLALFVLCLGMGLHFRFLRRWLKQSQGQRLGLLRHGALALMVGVLCNSWANVRQAGLLGHRSGLGKQAIILNVSQLGESVSTPVAPAESEIQDIWRESGLDSRYSFVSKEYPWMRKFAQGARCQPGVKKKNLLFIMLESFGAVSTSPLSPYYRHTTPEFAALAREGVLFSNAYMNSIPTAPALVSSLCSVYDIHKITDSSEGHQLRCGPTVLRERGYRTGFVVGTPIDFDGKRRFLGQNGVVDLIGDESFKLTPVDPGHAGQFGKFNDEETFREAMNWLDAGAARNEPFFLTLLTSSTHDPFPQYGSFENVEGEGKRKLLHSSMRYTDRELGKFLRELKKKPYYQDTVIFIFGDHPAWFSEDVNTAPGRDDAFLQSRIPLLILNPAGMKSGQVNDWVVSQVDLMPTALEMLGICENGAFAGNSLVSPGVNPRSRFAFVSAGHLGRFLYVTDRHGLNWDIGLRQARLFERRPGSSQSVEVVDLESHVLKESLILKLKSFEKVADWSIEANRFWNSRLF